SGVGDGAVISTCTGWVSVGSGVSVASGVGVAGRGGAVITITTGVLVGLPGSPSISSDTSPTATPASPTVIEQARPRTTPITIHCHAPPPRRPPPPPLSAP